MPVLTVYHHGGTAGVPPSRTQKMPAKRGNVTGWSQAATRRNTKFLYSVREKDLHGDGYAVTLTIRECPSSHAEWETLRKRYVDRLRRAGALRLHWVTEWQRRGVPHLHFAVWFEPSESDAQKLQRQKLLQSNWIECGAGNLGAEYQSQHCTSIDSTMGWFQYVSKHASRGAGHYQRSSDAIPKQWVKTGRMWGTSGDWPTDPGMKFSIDNDGFFAYRRIVRGMRFADARASGNRRRMDQARKMLRAKETRTSAVRGVSEWVSMDLNVRILVHLGAQGYEIEQVA